MSAAIGIREGDERAAASVCHHCGAVGSAARYDVGTKIEITVCPDCDDEMHEDSLQSSDYCADPSCDGERERDPAGQQRRHCAEHHRQRLAVLRAIRRPRERSDLGKPKSRQAARRRLIALSDVLPSDASSAYYPLADATGALEALIAHLEDESRERRSLADIWEDALLVVEEITEWTSDLFATPEAQDSDG